MTETMLVWLCTRLLGKRYLSRSGFRLFLSTGVEWTDPCYKDQPGIPESELIPLTATW